MILLGTNEIVHIERYLQPKNTDAIISFNTKGRSFNFRVQFTIDDSETMQGKRSIETSSDSTHANRGLITFTNWGMKTIQSTIDPIEVAENKDITINLLAAASFDNDIYSVTLQFMVDTK